MKYTAQFYPQNSQAVEQSVEYDCSLKDAKGQAVSHAYDWQFYQIVLSRKGKTIDTRTGEKGTYTQHISYFSFGNGYWQDFK